MRYLVSTLSAGMFFHKGFELDAELTLQRISATAAGVWFEEDYESGYQYADTARHLERYLHLPNPVKLLNRPINLEPGDEVLIAAVQQGERVSYKGTLPKWSFYLLTYES